MLFLRYGLDIGLQISEREHLSVHVGLVGFIKNREIGGKSLERVRACGQGRIRVSSFTGDRSRQILHRVKEGHRKFTLRAWAAAEPVKAGGIPAGTMFKVLPSGTSAAAEAFCVCVYFSHS